MNSCKECVYNDLELLEYPCSVCNGHSEWSQKRKMETPEYQELPFAHDDLERDIIAMLKQQNALLADIREKLGKMIEEKK